MCMPLTKAGSEEQPSSVRRSTQIRYAVLGALAFIVRFAAFGSFFPYIFLCGWQAEHGGPALSCLTYPEVHGAVCRDD